MPDSGLGVGSVADISQITSRGSSAECSGREQTGVQSDMKLEEWQTRADQNDGTFTEVEDYLI